MFEIFKVIHITAFAALFMGLGGLVMMGLSNVDPKHNARLFGVIAHGAGLLVLFVTGFGMLGALKLSAFPWQLWIFAKIALFVVLGGALPLIKKKPGVAWAIILPVLALAVAFFAVVKVPK